jgi:hypothetical protein
MQVEVRYPPYSPTRKFRTVLLGKRLAGFSPGTSLACEGEPGSPRSGCDLVGSHNLVLVGQLLEQELRWRALGFRFCTGPQSSRRG